ncbi:transcription regulator [Moniliophthora roreri MCA 2997]|uniref:Transcription regulator n=1 Tax=Moniliophthora roreri (strain MCA 2997) TaxID=1381753 RepID=V2XAT5_MONRO|nr:transcription regulator [Moniliophthora roreri MCA 2997]
MTAAQNVQIISSANDLLAAHAALISRVREIQKTHRRQLQGISNDLANLPLIPSPPRSPSPKDSPPASPTEPRGHRTIRQDLPPAKRARTARYKNYVPEEETIRNDYSQRYVDSGEWPQNWVLGAEPEHRFEEYPKQQRLLNLKKTSVKQSSLPPSYLPFSELGTLAPSKFDVILLDPPFSSSFTWENLQSLPIPSLAADPSFVFLWVGSGAGDGLERGREVLAKWGYRRCEDVVWVKTNKTSNKGPGTDAPTTSLLTRTKQHCLIGIRGTVRRSTDSWFVHCNVDTDVIIWEGDPIDPMRKPPEMYTLIENFCLGTRRLEVFGRTSSSLRRGWVTLLSQVEEEEFLRQKGSESTMFIDGEEGGEVFKWERDKWDAGIKELANGGKAVVPLTSDIDALRPKSPFRPGSNSGGPGAQGNSSSGGSSGGVQMGIPGMNPFGMGINAMNMGMGNGMGNGINGMDGMMGAWPGMMGGMGNGANIHMANMGMNPGPMGNANGMGMPMVGMGGGFQPQQNGNFVGMPAMQMFNGGMMGTPMTWGDQGQYGMDGNWEGEMVGMNAHMNANGLPGVNMGGNFGMGQWGQ